MERKLQPVPKPYQSLTDVELLMSEETNLSVESNPNNHVAQAVRPYGESLKLEQQAAALPGNTKSARDLTHVERYRKLAELRGLDVSAITGRAKIGESLVRSH